jgi:hypothetical protein
LPPMPTTDFRREYGDEPLRVMLDDRGPQITLEFPNSYQLSAVSGQEVCNQLGANFEWED